jgi:hypothetical protein
VLPAATAPLASPGTLICVRIPDHDALDILRTTADLPDERLLARVRVMREVVTQVAADMV